MEGRKANLLHNSGLFVFSAFLVLIFFSSCASAAEFVNSNFDGTMNGWSGGAVSYPGGSSNFYYYCGIWHNSPDLSTYYYVEQTVNLTDVNYIDFYQRIQEGYGGTPPFSLYVSLDGETVYSKSVSNTDWIKRIVPISNYHKSGNTVVRVFGSSTDYFSIGLDAFHLNYSAPIEESGVLKADSVFEYGKECWYEVNLTNIESNSVFVDIYGKNNTDYVFLETLYPSIRIPYVNPYVSFTAPSVDSGYIQIYAVLRTADNNTLDNKTDILVSDTDNYFKFIPAVVGYGQKTTLYYHYNYEDLYPYDNITTDPYQIRKNYYWVSGSNIATDDSSKDSSILVNNLDKSATGQIEFTAPYLDWNEYENGVLIGLINHTGKFGYGLYRNTAHEEGESWWHGNYLIGDVYSVDPDFSTPETPKYIPNPSPEIQSEINTTIPKIPDPYESPSYPVPPSPSHDDDGDNEADPGDNPNYPDNIGDYNSTSYDITNDTWNYNNPNQSGFYPANVPGNTSVDVSRFQGFYDNVDSIFSPLNSSVNGFVTFLINPISQLTEYINETKTQFEEGYDNSLLNNSFLIEVVSPVMKGFPPEIYLLVSGSLVLSIITLILRGSK